MTKYLLCARTESDFKNIISELGKNDFHNSGFVPWKERNPEWEKSSTVENCCTFIIEGKLAFIHCGTVHSDYGTKVKSIYDIIKK